MSRDLAARFQRWFEHERHAHDQVLRSLESVPPERRSGPEFEKAVAVEAAFFGRFVETWKGAS